MSAVGPAQTPEWQPEPAGPLMGVRAFAVVMGGPLVLIAAAIASAAVSLRALARRQAPPAPAGTGVATAVAYARLFRPWMKTWGARPEEAEKRAPGRRDRPRPRASADAGDHGRGAAGGGVAVARATRPGPRRLLQLPLAREPRRLPDAGRTRGPGRVGRIGASGRPSRSTRPQGSSCCALIPVARSRSNGGTWRLSLTAPAAPGSTHARGRRAAPPRSDTSCSSSFRTS